MIEQIIIATCSAGACWMSQCKTDDMRRWACVLGLISQPAWYWAAIEAQQWGILAVCPIYTWAWVRGFMHHWWGRR